MRNLKDYTKDELAKYVLVNCIVLLLISGDLKMDAAQTFNAVDLLGGKLFNVAVIVFIMYIYTFILNSMISDVCRKRLVWFRSPMPGEVIFKEIRESSVDKRFTSEKVRQVFSEIYSEAERFEREENRREYENQEWYRIYSEIKEDSMVFYSNREYLLLRDMYISTWFMALISALLCLCGMIHMSVGSMGFLLALLIFTNMAARQKGRRFAYNVIAVYIGKKSSGAADDTSGA